MLDGCVTAPVDDDRSIVVLMREEAAYWLAEARASFEAKEFFDMDEENLTLEDVEAEIQGRLDLLQRKHDEGFERPSFEQWIECYTALTQVKQAQALENIVGAMATHNHWLEQIAQTLKSLDDNSIVTQRP